MHFLTVTSMDTIAFLFFVFLYKKSFNLFLISRAPQTLTQKENILPCKIVPTITESTVILSLFSGS